MDKTIDDLISELSKRWQGEKRQVFVFSDSPGHYWTKLAKYSDLSDLEKGYLVS